VLLSVWLLVGKIVPLLVLVPGGLPGGDVTMVLERNLRKFTRNGWSRCLKLISTFSLARNENCVVDGLGGGRAIAWKATDASLDVTVDDTVDGIFDVGLAGLGLVVLSVAVKCKSNLLKLSNLSSIR